MSSMVKRKMFVCFLNKRLKEFQGFISAPCFLFCLFGQLPSLIRWSVEQKCATHKLSTSTHCAQILFHVSNSTVPFIVPFATEQIIVWDDDDEMNKLFFNDDVKMNKLFSITFQATMPTPRCNARVITFAWRRLDLRPIEKLLSCVRTEQSSARLCLLAIGGKLIWHFNGISFKWQIFIY